MQMPGGVETRKGAADARWEDEARMRGELQLRILAFPLVRQHGKGGKYRWNQPRITNRDSIDPPRTEREEKGGEKD